MTMPSASRTTTLLVHSLALLCLGTINTRGANAPLALKVDARDVSRRVLHATLHIPARPGPLTLVYPKWIPGEHGPTGPITDLAGLKMTADGQPIAWQRAPLDNYTFQVQVPTGANAVDVSLDFL